MHGHKKPETGDAALSSAWRRQRGFTIIELLVALVLLGIVATLSGSVILFMQKQSARNARNSAGTGELATIVTLVSRDFLRCRSVEMIDEGGLSVVTSDGVLCQYTCDDGSLMRDGKPFGAPSIEFVGIGMNRTRSTGDLMDIVLAYRMDQGQREIIIPASITRHTDSKHE